MKRASVVMGLVFLFAAAVQWNDPDPWLWIAAYGAASALSFAAAAGRSQPTATLLAFCVFTSGAAYLFPAVLDSSWSAYGSFEMKSTADEEARECVGLLVGAVWLGVLWWRSEREG